MFAILSRVLSGLRLRHVVTGLLALSVFALLSTPGIASEAIASAVSVKPQADGLLEGKSIVLAAKMPLYEGQKITTGAQGEVQVVFADNTHMVVGPGSSLLIERYLMTGSGGTASQFAISALGGTFRFITGNSKKTAYKIDTPTGTIGVRGTQFDFAVNKKTRKTTVVLFEGLVLLCGSTGQCASMSQTCGVAEMGSGQQAQIVGDDKIKGLSAGFPYVKSQQPLRADFKVKVPRNCLQPTTITGSIAPPKPDEGPSSPPPELSGGGGIGGSGGGGDSGSGRGDHNNDNHPDNGNGNGKQH